MSITNYTGEGMLTEGLQRACFSAFLYSTESMDPAMTKKQHPNDLRSDSNVYLHVDLKQSGVSSDGSWGAFPHGQYRLQKSNTVTAISFNCCIDELPD